MNEKPKTIRFLIYIATDGNASSVYGSELMINESKDALQYIMNRRLYGHNCNRYNKEEQ